MSVEIYNQELFSLTWACLAAFFVLGHNLWLVGRSNGHGQIRLAANTSDSFPASDSAVKPKRIKNFSIVYAENSVSVTDYRIEGNSLIADVETSNNSFYAALELRPRPITLEAEKFRHYITDEDALTFKGNNFSKPQRESYAKFAKVFCPSGRNSNVFNLNVGHRFEIVPQTRFADLRDEQQEIIVKVLFENRPIADLRVSSGCESLDGGKYYAHARTDQNGLARISILNRGHWFVRTHFIRPHEDTENFEWESFWASITFRI